VLTAGQLARARAAAADLMDDTCTVVRRTLGALNEETGQHAHTDVRVYPPVIDPEDEDEIDAGPCRVKQSEGARPSQADAAGQLVAQTALTLSLPPATSTGVQDNDIVIIRTSKYDPSLPGKEYRIAGPHGQTHATARRFPIEETT
jgi:hypothetical protein